MDDDTLVMVLGRVEWFDRSLSDTSYEGDDIGVTCRFLYLYLSGNTRRLGVYRDAPGLGKWSHLARFLLSLDLQDLTVGERLTLCSALERILKVLVIENEYEEGDEQVSAYGDMFLRSHRSGFLGLFKGILSPSLPKGSIPTVMISLLEAGDPFGVFLTMCNNSYAVQFYGWGIRKGIFPPITTRDGFKTLVVRLKEVNRLNGFTLDHLGCEPFLNELLDEDIARLLLESGYKDVLMTVVSKGWDVVPEVYRAEAEQVLENINLSKELDTHEKVVRRWDGLSDDQRYHLFEVFSHKESLIRLGELPYEVYPLELALIEAGKEVRVRMLFHAPPLPPYPC